MPINLYKENYNHFNCKAGCIMHVEFKKSAGIQSLLNQNTLANGVVAQRSKTQSVIKVIDPLAAAQERLIKKLNDFPNDRVAQKALRERLGTLSINDAFAAARDKNEDGSTWVNLESSKTMNGKTVTTKEPHRVYVDNLTRRINEGLAKGESIEDLSKLLDEASQGSLAAHSEVRNILTSLGKLDKNSREYINTSESYVRFGLDKESAKIHGEEDLDNVFKNAAGWSTYEQDKSLFFTVTTNEGDEIKISLSFNSNKNADELTYGKSVSLNYSISGDINAKEQQAFDELLAAVAEASDALLNGAEYKELIGMEVFDGSQLEGFRLDLGGAEVASGEARNRYRFEYHHDDKKQHLYFDHSLTTGYNIGLRPIIANSVATMSLSSNIGGSYDQGAVQTMLDVLAQGSSVAHKNDTAQEKQPENNYASTTLFSNAVQTLFKTAERLGKAIDHANKHLDNSVALANEMFKQISATDPRYQGIDAQEKDRIQSGFSTLADHQLSFEQQNGVFSKLAQGYDVVKKMSFEELYADRNHYSANFNQQTTNREITDSSNKSGYNVKQTRNYEADAEKKYDQQQTGFIARNHTVKDKWQASENYSVNLAAIEGSIVGLDQNRKRAESRDSFTYLGSGQYMRKESAELSEAQSKIRILDGFWVEKNSYENKGFRQFSLYNGRREEDLDKSSIVYVPHNIKQETLSMIGDLKKGAEYYQSYHVNTGSKTDKNLTMIDELKKLRENSDSRHQKIKDVIKGINEIDKLMSGDTNKLDFKI